MKWQVVAADAQTGEESAFVVEAATPAAAEAQARGAGYLVSQVTPASQGAVSPAGERPDALAELAAAAATGPATLPYRPPVNAPGTDAAAAAPEYWGLRFGSVAFLVIACLCYLAGAFGVLLGLGALLNSLGQASGPGAMAAFGSFLLSISPLAAGTMFHAASSACLALRDIARNSFRG